MREPRQISRGKRLTCLWLAVVLVVMIMLAILMAGCDVAWAESFVTETSWYSNIETKGRNCADGKYHDLSKELVCASWEFKLGTKLIVRSARDHRKYVEVTVVDRGPAKRLCRAGRRIDLSQAAFRVIEETSRGLAMVTVERIGG